MNRMYDEFADIWPLISHHSDYAAEARHWRDALTAALGAGRLRILELGVGGGNNLHHIVYPDCEATLSGERECGCEKCGTGKAQHDAVGVDLSEKMLANSRALNPDVEHYVGDMRSVRLGRRFDAVLIHDAACYLVSEADIRATLATARAHLREGGALIMAPDWFKETFPGTQVTSGVRRDVSPEFASVEYEHDPDPSDTTLESVFLYIIKGADGNVRVEEDRHITGIFPIGTWLGLMEEAGFRAKRLPYPVHEDGRDGWLLAGVLRASAAAGG